MSRFKELEGNKYKIKQVCRNQSEIRDTKERENNLHEGTERVGDS